MGTLLNNIVKGNTDINDEVIVGNMISSATLTSSTPELRALYSTSLNGIIGGHSALTALAVNRGWATPYNRPSQQLADTCKKSETTVENK